MKGELPVGEMHRRFAARAGDDLVRKAPDEISHHRRLEPAPDEAFGAEDGVLRVDEQLAFGGVADDDLALLVDGDDRRDGVVTLARGNYEGLAVLDHCGGGVGRAEVDADHRPFFCRFLRQRPRRFGLERRRRLSAERDDQLAPRIVDPEKLQPHSGLGRVLHRGDHRRRPERRRSGGKQRFEPHQRVLRGQRPGADEELAVAEILAVALLDLIEVGAA